MAYFKEQRTGAEAREQDREQMKDLFIDKDVTRRKKETDVCEQ